MTDSACQFGKNGCEATQELQKDSVRMEEKLETLENVIYKEIKPLVLKAIVGSGAATAAVAIGIQVLFHFSGK